VRGRHCLLALVCALAALLAGCSDGEVTQDAATTVPNLPSATDVSVVAPGGEWGRADPTATRIDPKRIDALDALLGADSDCMAVIEDGRIVRDSYWRGTTVDQQHEVFSVTKSITSTLVGIAEAEGLFEIDDPASRLITEWVDTPSEAVTIRQLAANDSGRFWSLAKDYGELIPAPDKTAFAIGLTQEAEPATEWNYNNAAIQTLDAVISRASGVPTAEFARTRLFEPMGMRATMTKDATGNTMTFMGAQASCLDLARFGYLLLEGGRWGDRQIVPGAWVAEATAPASDLNQAYGFLFWLNRPGRVKTALGTEAQGPIWPAAPADTFAALGLGGQTLVVVPDEGLVVTRIADVRGSVGQQDQLAGEILRVLVGP
jgi:CubicO group peptidase (beta-lactamase class C family)